MSHKQKFVMRVLIAIGLFIMSIPLALYDSQNAHLSQFASRFLAYIAFSLLISSSITLSRKIIYWGLLSFIWLICIGLWFDKGFPLTWFLFPLGLSIILGACYRLIVGKSSRSQPQPKDDYLQHQPPMHMDAMQQREWK